MRVLFALFLLVSLVRMGMAQEKTHEIKLYTGETVQGARLLYERPILKTPYFLFDGVRYETGQVEFFRNNHGRFANLGSLWGGKERYALKIKSGKIDLYEEVDMAIYGGDVLDVELDPFTSTSPLLAGGEDVEFYVLNGKPIQKAKYRYLKLDLVDNEASMKQLNDFKKYRLLQYGVLSVGLATTVGSLFMNDNNRPEFSPLTALGIIVAGSSYLFEYPKRDAILNSIDSYNEDQP